MVFDPCLGTGTTIDAAIQMKRCGVGCEIDKDCCAVISKRLWDTAEKMIQKSNLYKINFERIRRSIGIKRFIRF